MLPLAPGDERRPPTCAAAPRRCRAGRPSARGSTLVPPAGRTPIGIAVAGAVQHLVGGAVTAHRADAVEAERDRLGGELDRVLVPLRLDHLDVAVRLERAQRRPHRALLDAARRPG